MAGTQQLTLVLEVVPVDWGDRGRFGISAHLLPIELRQGVSGVTPIASALAQAEVVP